MTTKAIILAVMLLTTTAAMGQSPDGTTMPPAPELIDAQGHRWLLGFTDNPTPHSGCDTQTEICALPTDVMIACKGVIYGLNRENARWYRGRVNGGWTDVGPNHPCAL